MLDFKILKVPQLTPGGCTLSENKSPSYLVKQFIMVCTDSVALTEVKLDLNKAAGMPTEIPYVLRIKYSKILTKPFPF